MAIWFNRNSRMKCKNWTKFKFCGTSCYKKAKDTISRLMRNCQVSRYFDSKFQLIKVLPRTKMWDRSLSAIGNHAVIPARAAHFHGAVSPRLVPIKQLGGGSPPEDSQQLCHGRVWGRLDRQAGYSQAASLGLLLPTSAHPDRSNRQLRSTQNYLVLGGRPNWTANRYQDVTKDEEGTKGRPDLCKPDSQI